MFNLRYYQQQLIDQAHQAWQTCRSTAIISATASGKSHMYLAMAVAEPGRVMVLVHRDYLISQPIRHLEKAGFTDVAVEKAKERAEANFRRNKIVFASVQSIGPVSQEHRLTSFDPFAFTLLIIDEGHRGTAPSYRRVINHFRTNPRLRVLVLTATPNRKDGVALRNICESVAGVYGPSQAMAEGWIVPVKFYRRDVESLDFSNVRLKGVDLDPDQVEALLTQEGPLHEVCASLAEDRGRTIVFCPNVNVARAYETLLNKRYRPGRARLLYEDSSDDEREEIGQMLANGDIDYLCNVGIVTEGYDIPELERVVWAAPTASLTRYVQGVGRVFRVHRSLLEHLGGGPEDAADRRLLIAQSPKPFGIVVTYYPQNCKHDLCDPVDILGGDDLAPDVKAAAKQVQDETARQGGGSSTDTDIETGRIFCDFRTILDDRLKQLKARARFADQQYDPMSGRRRDDSTRTAGEVREAAKQGVWPQGKPVSPAQARWLMWKGVPPTVVEQMTAWRAFVVRELVDMGVRIDTAMSYGKDQALAVKEKMKAKQETDSP